MTANELREALWSCQRENERLTEALEKISSDHGEMGMIARRALERKRT